MAKEKAPVVESMALPELPASSDPTVVHAQVSAWRDKIYNRVHGTHRWRITIPNYACYRYFECEYGPSDGVQAEALWLKTIGSAIPPKLKDKFEFAYEGLTAELGPSPVDQKIPAGQRKITHGRIPDNLASFIRR